VEIERRRQARNSGTYYDQVVFAVDDRRFGCELFVFARERMCRFERTDVAAA